MEVRVKSACQAVSSCSIRTVVLECFAVFVAGILFALLANTLSPRGLTISTNYFPDQGSNRGNSASFRIQPSQLVTNQAKALELLSQRMLKHGILLVDSNQISRMYQDAKYEQELYVFIDARREKDYEKGHIPGAYQFDRYYPEKYIGTILPVCQTAERIVVYCNGGDCDDSEFAAVSLKNAGISETNITVYGGGMKEWLHNRMPAEIGTRKSGNLIQLTP